MKKLLMMGVRRPWWSFIAVVAITVLLARVTVNGAYIETDLDEYMPNDHPAFMYSDEAEELFGIHDGVLIVVRNREGIYRESTLSLVRDVTEGLPEAFDEIEPEDITSLYTAENIVGSEWGLEVDPFYSRVPTDPDRLAGLGEAVRSNEMIFGRIVSRDETATLVIAEIPDERLNADLYERLDEWIDRFEGPEELYIAGRPIVEGELARLGPADMQRMAPLVIVVTAVILLLLLRSVADTLVNLLVVAAGAVWSFGAMTLLGVPVYSVSTMIPVMLIAIGTAFGIHLHNAAHLYRAANPGALRLEIAEHAVSTMLRPVSMAAITTAIGFLSLLTSQVLPVKYFGAFTALGVLIEMVLALILVPGAIVAFGMRAPKIGTGAGHLPAWSRALSQFVSRRAGITLAVAALVVVGGAWGMTRVWIDTSFLANFEDDSDIVVTDTFVNDNFPGTSTLNIVIDADHPDAFKEPAVLRAIDDLQSTLESHPDVGETFALTDYLKRMHRVMHEDRADYYAIPDDQDLVAQYLLLYEMSGDSDNLNRVVDYDYLHANLTVQVKNDSSAVMDEIIGIVERDSDRFADLGLKINFAGSGFKPLVFAELLLNGQMWSLVIAFGIVAILLAIVFRSIPTGIIGTIPIAITAVVNFGVMGLLGIPLSSSTAIISSIAIGIGVDYAIHLIERFNEHMTTTGNPEDAAAHTLAHSGRAILFNAIAVMGGFAVLGWSLFPPNRQVGGLIALNMATSAAGTLTVLPAVLIRFRRRKAPAQAHTTTQGGPA